MNTMYVIGYQPIDIVDKSFKLVDIINLIIENKKIINNNIFESLINFLKELKMDETDYLLLNSVTTRYLVPYCSFRNTLLFDPPYITNVQETKKILGYIYKIITKKSNNIYFHQLNTIRSILHYYRQNIPQSDFFQYLMLLSDLNNSNFLHFEEKLLTYKDAALKNKYKHFAVFFGDVVDPSFFEHLDNKGVYVLKFIPYEYFSVPVTDIDEFYSEFISFKSPLDVLIELKQLFFGSKLEINFAMETISVNPDILILNPGGIYLKKEEANFFCNELKNVARIYILPGIYSGITLNI